MYQYLDPSASSQLSQGKTYTFGFQTPSAQPFNYQHSSASSQPSQGKEFTFGQETPSSSP